MSGTTHLTVPGPATTPWGPAVPRGWSGYFWLVNLNEFPQRVRIDDANGQTELDLVDFGSQLNVRISQLERITITEPKTADPDYPHTGRVFAYLFTVQNVQFGHSSVDRVAYQSVSKRLSNISGSETVWIDKFNRSLPPGIIVGGDDAHGFGTASGGARWYLITRPELFQVLGGGLINAGETDSGVADPSAALSLLAPGFPQDIRYDIDNLPQGDVPIAIGCIAAGNPPSYSYFTGALISASGGVAHIETSGPGSGWTDYAVGDIAFSGRVSLRVRITASGVYVKLWQRDAPEPVTWAAWETDTPIPDDPATPAYLYLGVGKPGKLTVASIRTVTEV